MKSAALPRHVGVVVGGVTGTLGRLSSGHLLGAEGVAGQSVMMWQ
jgi:hypothetical protein